MAKERREFLSGDIERLKQENLASEKENWLREKAQNVDQMQTMFERLYLNVGQGHKQARSASAKAKKRAAKQSKYNEKIALATEERYNAAVEAVNRRRMEFDSSLEDFKQRQARVKEIESRRASERISAYLGSKKQREEGIRAKEEELLRLLGHESKNYGSSHLHEIGVPVEIRKHSDFEEEDANARALEFNKMLKERDERNKKERAAAMLREAERTHAAAHFVRSTEMGKEVNKKLSNLWLADRQVKIDEFLQHQKKRVARKELTKTEKLEREIEDIFNLKPQQPEAEEARYATVEEVQGLNWSKTLPKGSARGPVGAPPVIKTAAGTKTAKTRAPISINLPKSGLRAMGASTKKPQQQQAPPAATPVREKKAAEASSRARRTPSRPKSTKKKGKASGQDRRLSRKGLKGIEGYLDERDPLNLRQLADDISLLTSSVLTDATELAKDEERFARQSLFSDTSTVMTFDDFTTESAERKAAIADNAAPSTSSDPSFLDLEGANLDFPELKAIDDLLSDSFFSLTALEDSSTKEEGSKTTKSSRTTTSSPFTLPSEDLAAERGDPGVDSTPLRNMRALEDALFSPSNSSSSSGDAKGKGKAKAKAAPKSLTSSLLDASDDDLIDDFLESFEGSTS